MHSFKEYEEIVKLTAIYPDSERVVYPALGLANEAGEVLGKLKKILRDKKITFSALAEQQGRSEDKEALVQELGDVLWYIAAFARDLGFSLEDVAEMNYEKLMSRKSRGTIGGSGDNR